MRTLVPSGYLRLTGDIVLDLRGELPEVLARWSPSTGTCDCDGSDIDDVTDDVTDALRCEWPCAFEINREFCEEAPCDPDAPLAASSIAVDICLSHT